MMLVEHRWPFALTAILALGASGCGADPGAVAPGPTCARGCEELAAAGGHPEMIAVGATHVYWTTFSFEDQRGAVLRAPVAGGDAEEVVSFDAQAAPRIALDATHLYWTEVRQKTGSVRRARLDGSSPELLADAVNLPVSLVVDSTSVYFNRFDATGLVKIPLAGGPVTSLEPGVAFSAYYAVDATHLYGADGFVNAGSIKRMPVAGGASEKLAAIDGGVTGFALGAESIYVTGYHQPFLEFGKQPVSTVWKVPRDGGSPVNVATISYAQGIAADESGVYFTDPDQGKVLRAALDGSSIEEIASGLEQPAWVALDAGNVYVSGSQLDLGTITRIVK